MQQFQSVGLIPKNDHQHSWNIHHKALTNTKKKKGLLDFSKWNPTTTPIEVIPPTHRAWWNTTCWGYSWVNHYYQYLGFTKRTPPPPLKTKQDGPVEAVSTWNFGMAHAWRGFHQSLEWSFVGGKYPPEVSEFAPDKVTKTNFSGASWNQFRGVYQNQKCWEMDCKHANSQSP